MQDALARLRRLTDLEVRAIASETRVDAAASLSEIRDVSQTLDSLDIGAALFGFVSTRPDSSQHTRQCSKRLRGGWKVRLNTSMVDWLSTRL